MLIGGQLQAAEPLYHLEKTITLGDGERWDYLAYDSASNRVYVAHGDHVDVVDPTKGEVIGRVNGIEGGSHGIAFAPKSNRVFTDDGKNGFAAIFDPHTFKIVKRIRTAPDADGMVYDSFSDRIFEVNGDSGNISVLDPRSEKLSTTVTAGDPLEAAVASGDGRLFVNGVDRHDVVVVDTRDSKVLAHYPMPGCERPHGIAFDRAASRIFSTCANKVMMALDARDGRVLASLPIGAGSDGAVFDARRHVAISANGEGTLTIVKETSAGQFEVIGTVQTARSARTIAIDDATGRLFLPAADIASEQPSPDGGRPHVTFVKGSSKLLVYAPRSE
jgi:DNA-binding beta-propeller fold protein YncE